MSAEHEHPLERDLERLGAQMLAESPPVTTAEVVGRQSSAPPLGDPLMNGHPVDVPLNDRREVTIGSRPSRGRRPSVLTGAAAAAAMLVVGLAVAGGRSGEPSDQSIGNTADAETPPTRVPAVGASGQNPDATSPAGTAEVLSWPPRLLLDGDWEIVTADERSINEGYVSYQRDGVTVLVGWYRGDHVLDGDDKALEGYTEVGSATLLGETVQIYDPPLAYSAGDIRDLVEQGVLESDIGSAHEDDALVGGPMLEEELAEAIADGLIEGVPTQGPQATLLQNASSLTVQVMTADALTPDEFAALLATVRQVEPSEWEAALPDRVVTVAERPGVVEELLADVPQPENSDAAFLGEQTLVQDRSTIANSLHQAVVCSWLNRYFEASDVESPEATDALEAIESIPDWPISKQLAELWENPEDEEVEGIIPEGNTGMLSLTVNDDGTITYEPTAEELDGRFAAGLCDPNAAG